MAGTVAGPSQTKKLPFKPTALHKPSLQNPSASPDDGSGGRQSYEDDDSIELFRRAREMAPIVARDRERRMMRRKKQQDKEGADKRRRSSSSKRRLQVDDDVFEDPPSAEVLGRSSLDLSSPRDEAEPLVTDGSMTAGGDSFRDLVTPPPSKRSRVGTASSSQKPIHTIEEANDILDESPSARRLGSTPKNRRSQRGPSKATATPTHANIISLDSDSDEPLPTPLKPRSDSLEIIDRSSPKISPPPEDDPFAAFVQKAAAERARFAVDNDNKIEIVITSTIPGSKPACFKFLFDKGLRLARDSWVGLQVKNRVPLDLAAGDEIILTWRRKKVYNVDTLLSLGIRPRGDGRVATDANNRHGDGLKNGATRVHMEAWTPALFREMEQEEALQRRRDAGELSDDDQTPSPSAEPAQPEAKLRVILRARDLEPVKLTVRPETTVETLITGFRTQRAAAVRSDQEVVLRWDGEALEEHATMEDADIDDMDTIEVYIK